MEVGVFGGTFDPPHVGHLVAARDALETLGLDRIRFVPAHRSPFKADSGTAGPEDRYEMLRLATLGDDDFEVSRVELDRPPPSFTVDTLAAFAEAEPGTRWTLLLGADQWQALGEWKDVEGIVERARIAVLTREGAGAVGEGPTADLRITPVPVPVTRLDVSSSDLRIRLRARRSVRHLIPDAVREFIESKELYASC
jgi:nicotinate-nucleotide adenylyltransferase